MTIRTITINTDTHKVVPLQSDPAQTAEGVKALQENGAPGKFDMLAVDVDDVYQAMLAAAPEVPTGWQPIESAPQDGTPILLHRNIVPIYTSCGEWADHRGGYWTTDFFDSVTPEQLMAGQPTHWMPLPQPPKVMP